MKLKFILLLATLPVMVSGCGHMPVSTMWALRKFDPVSADASQLRAAVRIPDTLGIQPGGTKIAVSSWRDGEEANKHAESFVLQETNATGDVSPLQSEQKAGTKLLVYRVNPDDLARIRTLQADIRAEIAAHPGARHGSLGVYADACQLPGMPDGAVLMTTFLRLESNQEFLPVVKNIDLREAAGSAKMFEELVPPCEKFKNRAEIKRIEPSK